jgi:hypothetical protein
MQSIITIHSLIRWAILLFGFWAVINGVKGLLNKSSFSANDKRSGLFFMICCDIQLLLGLILFISNGWFDRMKAGMGAVMKNPIDRFFTVEHGFMMILAWIFVHVGYSSVKKTTDENKHKKMVIFFGVALILILISIPWPFRADGVQRSLFPKF